MNKHKIRTIGFGLVIVVAAGLFCGGIWVLNGDFAMDESMDESMDGVTEKFFESYAKMSDEGEPENLLIVVSDKYPNTYGAIDVVEGPNRTYFMMYGSSEAAEMAYAKLQEDDLASVEKNIKMQLMDYNSWGITKMGLDKAIMATGYGGENIKVAVIDTGLNVSLFRDNYPDRGLETYNVEAESSLVEEMVDNDGHGTHVIGTITEGTPDNVSILALRATRGDSNELYSADVTTALYRVANSGAEVLNMSFGAYEQILSQKQALDTIKSRGIVSVAAAGNDATSEVLYPAGYDNTISISAINPNLSFASYSNYGQTIDFSAPGSWVVSINGMKSGTSMAAPHAVAAVAILKSYNDDLTMDDVKSLLKEHVRDLGDEGWDEQFGYGMIDYSNAEFCDGGYCDEYGVFATEAPTYAKAVIDEVTLTKVNYYSVSNLMLTEVKLYTDESNFVTKKLQDVYNLTISGYDAEASGIQSVTITCDGVSTTVNVENPNNYESGWKYLPNSNNELILTGYTDLKDLDFWNESVTRLYVPRTIGGKNVVKLAATERTYTVDDYTYTYTIPTFYDSSYASRNIKEVYLPDTVARIDDEVFMNFSSLERVVMEADGVSVGSSAFKNARKLKTVKGAVSEMGESAFNTDKNLKVVTLAEGMTAIPQYAFGYCSSLEQITIPSTVTTIGVSAFSNTQSLRSVSFLGNRVTAIGEFAFNYTPSLEAIVVPAGVERIGFNAFSNSGLKSVQIPASVTNIEYGAFRHCGNLETIVVDPNNAKYYDVNDRALMESEYSSVRLIAGTTSFTIPNNTTIITGEAFADIKTAGMLMIPDEVRTIESGAFLGCTGLTTVTIPKQTYVGVGAFAKGMDDDYIVSDVILGVYSGSLAYDYAVDGGYRYETMDASYARVAEAFDYGDVLSDDTVVEMYHDYGTRENETFTNHTGLDGRKEERTVSQLPGAEYAGEVEYFRIGDTYFNVTYKDALNKDASIAVNITVNGEMPEYTVPQGLTGKLRSSLNTVELPAGFSWMDGNISMGELGEHTYLARYTPGESAMYASIDNIEVTVTVVPGRMKLPEPEVTVESKVYDGSWSIDRELVIVSIDGLNSDDYTIYAWVDNNQVGITRAMVEISLDSSVAEMYGFGDDYSSYYYCYVDDYEILSDEPSVEIDDRTKGVADVEVVENGIVVTAEKACTVIVSYDEGETYEKVVATKVTGEKNTRKFEFEVVDDMEVKVVLKGDLDMKGSINAKDSAWLEYYLLRSSNPNHLDLNAIERLIADVNDSGTVTVRDAALVDYALLTTANPYHKDLEW